MEGIDNNTSNATSDAPPSYDAHQQDASPSVTPSIDEQVAHIQSLLNTPLEDGSKGYIVASKWFNRVVARTEGANKKDFDAEMLQEEIGKIDNSSVVPLGKWIAVTMSGHG
jgi:ubiquitin carboxyl-terminal hydrolase 4/11/15